MQTYKRTTWNLIKGILLAPFAAAGVFLLVAFILQFVNLGNTVWYVLAFGLPVLAFAGMLYSAIFSENIRFELDETGNFRYFKREKLLAEYALGSCRLGSTKRRSGLGSSYISLKILPQNGEMAVIDCEPLGDAVFDRMYAAMQQFAQQPEKTLTAVKK
ncbi:MAG: hypothetical protein ACK5L3_06510 [Oscillospiraceae bacterium]